MAMNTSASRASLSAHHCVNILVNFLVSIGATMLIALLNTGCASATHSSTKSGASDNASAPSLRAADAIGSWTLTDDENTTFDVVLAESGVASSNWSKGPAGARGEIGRWSIRDECIVAEYEDGWCDTIFRSAQGKMSKRSYAPGVARDGVPSNTGQAVRTPAAYASWVGVYETPLAQSRVGSQFYVSIQSSHAAWKTVDDVHVGSWWIEGEWLRVRWADGWLDEFRRDAGKIEVRSWKAGSPLDSKGNPAGDPTNIGIARRIH